VDLAALGSGRRDPLTTLLLVLLLLLLAPPTDIHHLFANKSTNTPKTITNHHCPPAYCLAPPLNESRQLESVYAEQTRIAQRTPQPPSRRQPWPTTSTIFFSKWS
jgi:hypothetical protein